MTATLLAQPLAMHAVWLRSLAPYDENRPPAATSSMQPISISSLRGSPMNLKRKILLALLAGLVVVAGGLRLEDGKGLATPGTASVVSVARPLELIAAELHTIRPRGLVDTVRFTGTTQPIDQTIVKARVAGRLAEVFVREGDRVTKGQLLARFETTSCSRGSTSGIRA